MSKIKIGARLGLAFACAAAIKSRLILWGVTVRDSFVVLLPITFLGVAATLIGNLPFPALRQLMTQVLGSDWAAVIQHVINATYGVFGLALAVVVSVRLTHRLAAGDGGDEGPQSWVGIAALANFMLWIGVAGLPVTTALAQHSMLQGIGIGLLTAELLRPLAALCRVAQDDDSEPVFYYAVHMTAPFVLLGLIVMLAAGAVASLSQASGPLLAHLAGAINPWMEADWLFNSGVVLLNEAFWFVGMHGNVALDQLAQLLFGITGTSFQQALSWRPLVDTFGLLGGSGAVLGLVLALFIVAREGPLRRLAVMSALPSLFNISELLIYGLPIALNPTFLCPFLLAPLVLTLMAVAASQAGLVPLHDLTVPWTTPPLLSGYLLTGSWHGAALQGAGLVVSTLIYLPFVRRAEARRLREQLAAFDTTIKAIIAPAQPHLRSVLRNGKAGLIARGLLATLARDIGTPALTLAFQPKHDRDGGAVGVEALLRWRHGRYGPVRADAAVMLAEQGGLIVRLGAWVLEEACACKARWNRQGLSHITMAINVSPLQLEAPALPALLAACLARHHLTPGEIQLEITESQAIPLLQVVDHNLTAIVGMGVSLAMDDFGMGYSSLLHMRRFPIQAIKIDGSLTRDVLTNPISRDIIHTIAALGVAREVEVVAEFVETVEQRDILLTLGCEVFQGYLYSPALPADDCARYLLTAPVPD
jgi:lactose/cellobiose-specific phosphotransferase system IIC component